MNILGRHLAIFLLIISTISFSLSAASQDPNNIQLQGLEKQRLQREIPILFALSAALQFHISPKNFNSELALEIAETYLNNLDPERLFFSAEQVEHILTKSIDIPDELENKQASFALNLFTSFKKEVNQTIQLLDQMLEDLQLPEHSDETISLYQYGATLPWIRANDLEKYRHNYLMNDLIEGQIRNLNSEQIKEKIRSKFAKFAHKINGKTESEVIGEYLNVILSTFDPHTNYLLSMVAGDMALKMSGELTGIGVTVNASSEKGVVIAEIVPQGPAAVSGEISVGDRIIAIAQGIDGVFEDVMDEEDTTKVTTKLRGPIDTVVRIKIALQGQLEKIKVVQLIRKKFQLAELAPQVKIYHDLPGHQGKKIAILTVNTFNVQTTKGAREILKALAQEKNLAGLVINLRGNGGGLLSEAVTFAGLFVRQGVITQQFDGVTVEKLVDPDPQIQYSGPLAVLVDRHSASASEIVAGFLKDSRRAIIIGERTFGKGTVQTLISTQNVSFIVQIEESTGPLGIGEVKITSGSYHLPSGNSPQYFGVLPDIAVPATVFSDNYGEKMLKNSLKVPAVKMAYFPIGDGHLPVNRELLPKIQEQSKNRLAGNAVMKAINELNSIVFQESQRKVQSLDLAERKSLAQISLEKKLQAINVFRAQLNLPSLLSVEALAGMSTMEEKRIGELMEEAPIQEALAIMGDYLDMH